MSSSRATCSTSAGPGRSSSANSHPILQRAEAPGNVLLPKGEGNLERASVVNVSQLYTVDKADLVEKIGALSKGRVAEIFAGLRLLLEPRGV